MRSVSAEMRGWRSFVALELRRHNSRKPSRCQRSTVSGFTSRTALCQDFPTLDRATSSPLHPASDLVDGSTCSRFEDEKEHGPDVLDGHPQCKVLPEAKSSIILRCTR
jgi:hypothetical protein